MSIASRPVPSVVRGALAYPRSSTRGNRSKTKARSSVLKNITRRSNGVYEVSARRPMFDSTRILITQREHPECVKLAHDFLFCSLAVSGVLLSVDGSYSAPREWGGRPPARQGPLGDMFAPSSTCEGVCYKKERKKTDNPREGWEDGTPPPHRDF